MDRPGAYTTESLRFKGGRKEVQAVGGDSLLFLLHVSRSRPPLESHSWPLSTSSLFTRKGEGTDMMLNWGERTEKM